MAHLVLCRNFPGVNQDSVLVEFEEPLAYRRFATAYGEYHDSGKRSDTKVEMDTVSHGRIAFQPEGWIPRGTENVFSGTLHHKETKHPARVTFLGEEQILSIEVVGIR